MSNTINNEANATEVDEPQTETVVEDGQVVESGAEASEAPLSEEDFFQFDEYADKPVRLKIDGEEVVVPLKEALAGYQRQADYTRKTQELSQQKKQVTDAVTLYDALARNPQETLSYLQKYYGIDETVQALEEEDDLTDPVLKQTRQELEDIKRWKQELEYRETLSTIEKELKNLEEKYGAEFNREEVVAKALELGSQDLEATFKLIAFDKLYTKSAEAEKKLAATTQKTQAKREAQVVSGASSSRGTGASTATTPKSVQESFRQAMKTHGVTELN